MSAPTGAFMLHLTREIATPDVTFGKLFVDGVWQWWTLEDPLMRDGVKIPGQSAIPAGSYRVTMSLSQRFGKIMPGIERVPGFAGVRIHAGNTPADTQGCILVGGGLNVKQSRLLHSRTARDAVYAAIRGAINSGRQVWIEVVDPAERRH